MLTGRRATWEDDLNSFVPLFIAAKAMRAFECILGLYSEGYQLVRYRQFMSSRVSPGLVG